MKNFLKTFFQKIYLFPQFSIFLTGPLANERLIDFAHKKGGRIGDFTFYRFFMNLFENIPTFFRKKIKKHRKRWNNFGQLSHVQNQFFFHFQVAPSKILRIEGGDTFSIKKNSKTKFAKRKKLAKFWKMILVEECFLIILRLFRGSLRVKWGCAVS